MTQRDDNLRSKDIEVGVQSELNQWGIPDWSDATAYGATIDWCARRWRWEFFRRRQDLRDYFDRWAEDTYLNDLECNTGLSPNDPGFLAFENGGSSHEVARQFDYLGIPNPRIGEQPLGAILPRSELLESTRLLNGANRRVRIRGVMEVVRNSTAAEFRAWLEPHEVTVKFDLNKPLQPQIDKARKMLKQQQRRQQGKLVQKRRHPDKWLGYLRTLDAREAGASWSQIAALHPNTAQTEQTARDIWEQARALCFKF